MYSTLICSNPPSPLCEIALTQYSLEPGDGFLVTWVSYQDSDLQRSKICNAKWHGSEELGEGFPKIVPCLDLLTSWSGGPAFLKEEN